MEINDLTHAIIGCAYKVHNVLGFGFVERVYKNSLRIELDSWEFPSCNKKNSKFGTKVRLSET